MSAILRPPSGHLGFCRRCGNAGSERVAPGPQGLYLITLEIVFKYKNTLTNVGNSLRTDLIIQDQCFSNYCIDGCAMVSLFRKYFESLTQPLQIYFLLTVTNSSQ